MSDLISRQDAILKMNELYYEDLDLYGVEIPETFDSDRAIEALENLPSAQPEIIRCKDCKHQPFDGEDTQGFEVEFPDEVCPCQCDDGWYNWRPDDDFYCGYAERREEE